MGRCSLELARGPSRVALAWHLARRSAPFGVTTSATPAQQSVEWSAEQDTKQKCRIQNAEWGVEQNAEWSTECRAECNGVQEENAEQDVERSAEESAEQHAWSVGPRPP